jgi:hypothetical protein
VRDKHRKRKEGKESVLATRVAFTESAARKSTAKVDFEKSLRDNELDVICV